MSNDFLQKNRRLIKWRRRFQNTHFIQVRIQASFILRGGVCVQLLQTSWSQNPVFPAVAQEGMVTVFLETSKETNIILCSTTFYVYANESVIHLKVRALRMGYLVYFRLQAMFFCKRCRASTAKQRKQHKDWSSRNRSNRSQACTSLLHLEVECDRNWSQN